MTLMMDSHCSFCQADRDYSQLVFGYLGARICRDCVRTHYDTSSASRGAAAAPSFDQRDGAEMLRTLLLISAEAAHMDRFLRKQVAMIRERNISYARIGEALGVSRQAAWERFSR